MRCGVWCVWCVCECVMCVFGVCEVCDVHDTLEGVQLAWERATNTGMNRGNRITRVAQRQSN